jgi:hypothetical protein
MVSLSQPNSLPGPTSFLIALPIIKLSSPQICNPRNWDLPSLHMVLQAFPLPSRAPRQGWLRISNIGDSRDASCPKKTNKTTHCSREISHTKNIPLYRPNNLFIHAKTAPTSFTHNPLWLPQAPTLSTPLLLQKLHAKTAQNGHSNFSFTHES